MTRPTLCTTYTAPAQADMLMYNQFKQCFEL